MYSKQVLTIFSNPKNAGRIIKPDGIAANFSIDGNANVEFSLRVESGIITDCKFRAQANPYITAACSMITEMVKAKMVTGLFVDVTKIWKELGDEDLSAKSLDFCIDCLKMAIDDYKAKLEKLQNIIEVDNSIEIGENPTISQTKNNKDDDFPNFFDDEFI